MANPQIIEVNQLPDSVDEFVALRDELAQTPQGGAVMMVLALQAYVTDPDLGWQCLTIAVDRGRLQDGAAGYKGWELIAAERQRIVSRLKERAHLPRSYVLGASPEEGYRLPPPPYRFEVSDNPYSGSIESGRYKVFLACSGAASPRPVTLKCNDQGIWKAHEWSSLLLGVVKPAGPQVDDL
jgi:hypothetical protein